MTAPTPYQPMNRHGGYTNAPFDSAAFRVVVEVNKHTPPDSADVYIRRRAREICRANGFPGFLVLDSNRSYHRTIRWLGPLQGELAYRTRVIAQVRCSADSTVGRTH
jgi:hypothetical protein